MLTISKSQQKIINSSIEAEVKVPAALNLPFGKLFFGFSVVPYTPPEQKPPSSPTASPTSAVSWRKFLLKRILIISSAFFLGFGKYAHGQASHITCRRKGEVEGETARTVATEREVLGRWQFASFPPVYPHSTQLSWA